MQFNAFTLMKPYIYIYINEMQKKKTKDCTNSILIYSFPIQGRESGCTTKKNKMNM